MRNSHTFRATPRQVLSTREAAFYSCVAIRITRSAARQTNSEQVETGLISEMFPPEFPSPEYIPFRRRPNYQ